jgi:DME family drug/metabolite transporter
MVSARLFILLAAVLWSTAGTLIKLSSLSAWQLSAGRSGVAAVVFALLYPSARRAPSRKTLWVSVAYAACVVLFVLANKLTTAANAIFIQDCAPLYIVLASTWFLGERPSRSEWIALPIFGAGMGLFFMEQLGPGGFLGNLLAVASGVAFAFSIMGLRRVAQDGAQHSLLWGNVLACAVSLPFAWGGGDISIQNGAVVLFLGVFQLAGAYAAFAHGLKRVPAVEASLLALLEPVLSAGWAWWLANEVPGPYARAGALMVLLATVWRTWAGARSASQTARA